MQRSRYDRRGAPIRSMLNGGYIWEEKLPLR